jgi:hypothetical protein
MNLRALSSASIIITRRKGKFTPKVRIRQQEDVEGLVKLFEGMNCEAYFTGGVGLALSLGDFYRYHKDFDVAIFHDDLERVAQHLKSKRYRLVERCFMTHLSPWHDIQVVTLRDLSRYDLARRDISKVKALKSGTPFRVIRRLSHCFDFFIWAKREEGIIPIPHNTMIPWDDFYPTTRISEKSSLMLVNINHKKHIPVWNDKQCIDCERAGLEYVKKS